MLGSLLDLVCDLLVSSIMKLPFFKFQMPATVNSPAGLSSRPRIESQAKTELSETVLPKEKRLVKELINALKRLKRTRYSLSVYRCMSAIWHLCVRNVQIETGAQVEIADLIHEVFPIMKEAILDYHLTYRNCGRYILKLRSSAQFLMDEFKNFCTSFGHTLEETVSSLESQLERWDEDLLIWKREGYLSYEDHFYGFSRDPNEFVRPTGVPQSHFWWAEFNPPAGG